MQRAVSDRAGAGKIVWLGVALAVIVIALVVLSLSSRSSMRPGSAPAAEILQTRPAASPSPAAEPIPISGGAGHH